MSTDNKEQDLQLAAYNTQNQITIHDSNIADSLGRWSVVLPFATLFYIWHTPSPPFFMQLVVNVVTIALLCVMLVLHRKYDALIEIRFGLMHDIEEELGFRGHKDVHDQANAKGIIQIYRKWRHRVTAGFILLLVLNLIVIMLEWVKC